MTQTIQAQERSAEGALLVNRAISLHFQHEITLSDVINNHQLLQQLPVLFTELKNQGATIEDLNARLRCGEEVGYMATLCGCGLQVSHLTRHCNNKTCVRCAIYRRNRIIRKLLPFLKQYSINTHSGEKLRFLTISPQNFNTVEEGYKEIRRMLSRFMRLQYIKERVFGAFGVVEVRTKNKDGECKGWNFHIHLLYYGRKLDNVIRGYCFECGQSLIKKDRYNDRYYCANRLCNSQNLRIDKGGNSKLVNLWLKTNDTPVIMHVEDVYSYEGASSYMLKYISMNKDDFYTVEHEAKFIIHNKHKRMISSYGTFYGIKLKMLPITCRECGCIKHFIYDDILINDLIKEKMQSIPPDDVLNGVVKFEIIKF